MLHPENWSASGCMRSRIWRVFDPGAAHNLQHPSGAIGRKWWLSVETRTESVCTVQPREVERERESKKTMCSFGFQHTLISNERKWRKQFKSETMRNSHKISLEMFWASLWKELRVVQFMVRYSELVPGGSSEAGTPALCAPDECARLVQVASMQTPWSGGHWGTMVLPSTTTYKNYSNSTTQKKQQHRRL